METGVKDGAKDEAEAWSEIEVRAAEWIGTGAWATVRAELGRVGEVTTGEDDGAGTWTETGASIVGEVRAGEGAELGAGVGARVRAWKEVVGGNGDVWAWV